MRPISIKLQKYADGSSPETAEDPADSSLKMRADQFRGALAQLQKEQEEERQKAEEEKLQAQVESQAISEGQYNNLSLPLSRTATYGHVQLFSDTSEAPETSEAPDTSEESSSVTPPPENPNNVLQEAAAGAPAASAPNTETQS